MLNDNLYRTDSFSYQEEKIEAEISIDIHHKIFEGHFPGQPVLPGVCMIQIVKELVEKAMNKKLWMVAASQCKFISLADPTKGNQYQITIECSHQAHQTDVSAIFKNSEAVILKMKCTYKPFPQ